MKPLVTMRGALADPALLGGVLVGPSWNNWRIKLIAANGEALNDDERAAFREMTGGREREPGERAEVDVSIAGRRAGKDRAASVQGAYYAALCDYSDVLAAGERGVVLLLAQNQKQAVVAFNYVKAIFDTVPTLAQMVRNITADTIELSNGVDIQIRAASFRGLRGPTYVHVIADEVAFWHIEGSSNPDDEIINAVMPGLATTGGMLSLISSPYAKRGVLYDFYSKHYGPNGDPRILVAQGASRYFNPTLKKSIVDRAIEKDAQAASAEWFGKFRSDLEQFVPREIVESAVDRGVTERPPIDGIQYFGFVDPSGGASDAMTLAIAHVEKRVLTLDATRERIPPFSPEAVVAEFADTLKRYRISTISGDRYAGEWPREAFARHGITYRVADKTRSELYLNVLPELNSKSVALLDNPKILAQFSGLERRTSRGGRDLIDHAPGQHDDVANAVAGALLMAKPNAIQQMDAASLTPISLYRPDPINAPHLGGNYDTSPGFGNFNFPW